MLDCAMVALGHFALGNVKAARKAWAKGGLLLRSVYADSATTAGTPRLVTHDGRTQNRRAWARELGLSTSGLSYRLKTMPEDVALLSPQVRANVARVWEIIQFARLLIALAVAEGNQRKAADRLGISAQRVSQLVHEYGMRVWVDSFRAAA